MAQTPSSTSQSGGSFFDRLAGLGARLGIAVERMLAALPDGEHATRETRRALGINDVLAHRLQKAASTRDPLALLHCVPGPEPLRRVLNVAERHGLMTGDAEAARSAIADFERTIRHHFGDRSGLDAVISSRIPDVRRKTETLAKQSVYRGARQLRGIAAETVVASVFMYPGSEMESGDLLWLRAFFGLYRIRPDAALKIDLHVTEPQSREAQMNGTLTEELHERFCGGMSVRAMPCSDPQDTVYLVEWGGAIGRESARDVVVADLRQGVVPRYYHPGDPKRTKSLTGDIPVPCRRYVLDVLMHDEFFPNWIPNVCTLTSELMGFTRPEDPARPYNIIDIAESINYVGRGVTALGLPNVPNYSAMLDHACVKLDWDPTVLRGYRCDISYPIWGSFIQTCFELPDAPTERPTSSHPQSQPSGDSVRPRNLD